MNSNRAWAWLLDLDSDSSKWAWTHPDGAGLNPSFRSMVSSVATTELTSYRKACATSNQLYSDYRIKNIDGVDVRHMDKKFSNILELLQGNREGGGRSLLLQGFKVASKRKVWELTGNQQANDRWELLFQLWVDMLSYAANHCKGKYHVEQLGTGGQFLTYVWLFMVHLLDSHYQIDMENGGCQ
ncbi:hypothetical protein Acr_07g0009430 [Actinidia rufa]|uniref:Uncharacterized protein n=1 Tax=Actinidia rufa TaxID=165716 RepID=A0A7J0EX01_9ERIC|nr:hypothetical protein Acr_07g0009430 [Actinidia rufa]